MSLALHHNSSVMTEGSMDIATGRVATNLIPTSGGRRMPMFIPSSQEYYWSSRWQEAELESITEYERGAFQVFEDPMDAVRDLLRADD